MTNIVFLLSSDNDGNQSIIVFDDNNTPHIVPGEHPSFNEILDKVQTGDKSAFDLLEPGKAIANAILSDRVEYKDNNLFFDGKAIAGELVNHIIKLVKEKSTEASVPYVKFLENLDRNPSAHSREQLFRFLEKNSFIINQDGNIIGYKGVYYKNTDFSGDVIYKSVHSGPAIINGKEHTDGPVPQKVGDVIEMPRRDVVDDPTVACSVGLHVGAWAYASTFASDVLACEVDPADVVSVPKDSSDQKIRVAKYKIVDKVTKPYDEALVETSTTSTVPEEEYFTPTEWSDLNNKFNEKVIDYTYRNDEFEFFVTDYYDAEFNPHNVRGDHDHENFRYRLNWIKWNVENVDDDLDW